MAPLAAARVELSVRRRAIGEHVIIPDNGDGEDVDSGGAVTMLLITISGKRRERWVVNARHQTLAMPASEAAEKGKWPGRVLGLKAPLPAGSKAAPRSEQAGSLLCTDAAESFALITCVYPRDHLVATARSSQASQT